MPDDQPWFCARCIHIIENDLKSKQSAIPNCFLCPDVKGAMVDLQSKEWVHHTCVNWHNEIWFEAEDAK